MTQQALPHWDLSNVYPSLESHEFEEDMARFRTGLDELDALMAEHQIAVGGLLPETASALAGTLNHYLDKMNAQMRLGGTLNSYIYGFFSTDSYNTAARRLTSELDALMVRQQRQEMLFRGWLGSVAGRPQLLEAALSLPGTSKEHEFYLRETVEQSRYLMSEAEETLAAELSLSGSRAWEKLQEVVSSQLKVSLQGQTDELPITVVQNMRYDPDEDVRRRAYEAELVAWESVKEPLAACLNGVKGAVNTLNSKRGRTDALHSSLDQARIDRDTLDAMLGEMHDSFPMFRGYWKAKAKLLGKEALPWWDLYAPVGKLDKTYGYAEGRALILEQLGTFSQRLASFCERAFDSGWIDAEPRDGKGGGAFCMRIPMVNESRILCNYDGSLDQVLTLAHELGHAYHNECHVGLEPLQRRTPMTLAETASIFNETVLTDAALAQAAGPDEELAILETFLIGASQTVVDIYSRFLFETEVFERRAEAELSANDFCEAMLRAQKATYGNGLDQEHLNPYMWAWKPHYYIPQLSFYNYPYAFGMLFALGLYAIHQERGASFLPEYDALLRATGAANAADLAARFGIDRRQPDFWKGSLAIIGQRV